MPLNPEARSFTSLNPAAQEFTPSNGQVRETRGTVATAADISITQEACDVAEPRALGDSSLDPTLFAVSRLLGFSADSNAEYSPQDMRGAWHLAYPFLQQYLDQLAVNLPLDVLDLPIPSLQPPTKPVEIENWKVDVLAWANAAWSAVEEIGMTIGDASTQAQPSDLEPRATDSSVAKGKQRATGHEAGQGATDNSGAKDHQQAQSQERDTGATDNPKAKDNPRARTKQRAQRGRRAGKAEQKRRRKREALANQEATNHQQAESGQDAVSDHAAEISHEVVGNELVTVNPEAARNQSATVDQEAPGNQSAEVDPHEPDNVPLPVDRQLPLIIITGPLPVIHLPPASEVAALQAPVRPTSCQPTSSVSGARRPTFPWEKVPMLERPLKFNSGYHLRTEQRSAVKKISVDNRSLVLALPTIWCKNPEACDRALADWPEDDKAYWEGDRRVGNPGGTGVRLLPLPRIPGSAKWKNRCPVEVFTLDQVQRDPQVENSEPAEAIEIGMEVQQHLIDYDLDDAMDRVGSFDYSSESWREMKRLLALYGVDRMG